MVGVRSLSLPKAGKVKCIFSIYFSFLPAQKHKSLTFVVKSTLSPCCRNSCLYSVPFYTPIVPFVPFDWTQSIEAADLSRVDDLWRLCCVQQKNMDLPPNLLILTRWSTFLVIILMVRKVDASNQTLLNEILNQKQNDSTNLISYEPLSRYIEKSPSLLSPITIDSTSTTTLTLPSTTPSSLISSLSTVPSKPSTPKPILYKHKHPPIKLPKIQVTKMYYSDSIPPPSIAEPITTITIDCKDRCDSTPTIDSSITKPVIHMESPSAPQSMMLLQSNETRFYSRLSPTHDSGYNPAVLDRDPDHSDPQDQDVSAPPNPPPNLHHLRNSNYLRDSHSQSSHSQNLFGAPPNLPSPPLPPDTLRQLLRPSLSSEMLDDELETINQQLIGNHHPSTDGTLDEYLKKLNAQSQLAAADPTFINLDSPAFSGGGIAPGAGMLPMQQVPLMAQAPQMLQREPSNGGGGLFTRFIDRMYRSPSTYNPEYIQRPGKAQSSGGGFLSNIFNFGSSASNKQQQQIQVPIASLAQAPTHTIIPATLPVMPPLLNYDNTESLHMFMNQPRPPSRFRMLMSRHRLGLGLGLGSPAGERKALQQAMMNAPEQYLPTVISPLPRGEFDSINSSIV